MILKEGFTFSTVRLYSTIITFGQKSNTLYSMRFSNLMGRTQKEDVKDAEIISHNLLIRGGYIRQLAAGIFSYMHLGQRSLKKIEQILREEMNRIGGVEICMPVVHPADIWKKTRRWHDIDDSLVRFQDRGERDMVLAMTHEEVVAELCRTEINSYRQFPKLVYQIYTKFRDEARPRAGLIRVREFTMKDSYSLDATWEGLEKQYIAHYDAYFRIGARAALPLVAVLSDTGMMGGRVAHEFMYLTPIGEDTIYICDESGYRANKEVATFKKTFVEEAPQPLQKVHTPAKKTIDELAEFLNVEASRTAKAVFMYGVIEGEEKVILAVVRGDMELNTIKLQKHCKSDQLRPATEDEIKSIGAVPGYASPIGIDRSKALVIVDDLIVKSNNLVAGANEVDYHYENVCYDRDYTADMVEDIVSAYDGATCPISDNPDHKLRSVRGIEVGNIFQLGSKYTNGMGARFMDENGREQDIIMGSYGIGVGRILACLVEEYQDERGIRLPISIAPYEVILVSLQDNEEVIGHAESLYEQMQAAGIDILLDDRHKKVASPGIKFGDADLIGIPIRLTISKRSLKNGGLEFKVRDSGESEIIPVEQVVEKVQAEIARQFAEIKAATEGAEKWQE